MNEVKDKARLIMILNEKIATIAEQREAIGNLLIANRTLYRANAALKSALDETVQKAAKQVEYSTEIIKTLETQFCVRSQRHEDTQSLKAEFEAKLNRIAISKGESKVMSAELDEIAGICDVQPNNALISKFGSLSSQEMHRMLVTGKISRELITEVVRPLMHANSTLKEMMLTTNFLKSSFQAQSMILQHSNDCICSHYISVLQCILSCDFMDNLLLDRALFDIIDLLGPCIAGAVGDEIVEQLDDLIVEELSSQTPGLKEGYRIYFYTTIMRERGSPPHSGSMMEYLSNIAKSSNDYQADFYYFFIGRLLDFTCQLRFVVNENSIELADSFTFLLENGHKDIQASVVVILSRICEELPTFLHHEPLVNALEEAVAMQHDFLRPIADLIHVSVFLESTQGMKYSGVLRTVIQQAVEADNFSVVERMATLVLELDIRELKEQTVSAFLATAHSQRGHSLKTVFELVAYQSNAGNPRDSEIYGTARTEARIISPNPERIRLCSEIEISYVFSVRFTPGKFSEIICDSRCEDEVLALELALLLKNEPFRQETLDFFVRCLIHFAPRRGEVLPDCADYIIDNYQYLQVQQLENIIYAITAAASQEFEYYESVFTRILDICRFVSIKNEELITAVVRSRLIARKGCSQALREKVLEHLIGE